MTLDEVNTQAMQMIVSAGDARTLLNKALDTMYEGKDDEVDSMMAEASKKITEAHTAQTKVLQQTITDEEFRPNILFTHAQDTLMTIMSEVNIAKQLIKLYRNVKHD